MTSTASHTTPQQTAARRDAGNGDRQARREIARRLEAEHPGWIVIYGTYSREYVCFPRSGTPHPAILTATDPRDLAQQIRHAEETSPPETSRRHARPPHAAPQRHQP